MIIFEIIGRTLVGIAGVLTLIDSVQWFLLGKWGRGVFAAAVAGLLIWLAL